MEASIRRKIFMQQEFKENECLLTIVRNQPVRRNLETNHRKQKIF